MDNDIRTRQLNSDKLQFVVRLVISCLNAETPLALRSDKLKFVGHLGLGHKDHCSGGGLRLSCGAMIMLRRGRSITLVLVCLLIVRQVFATSSLSAEIPKINRS